MRSLSFGERACSINVTSPMRSLIVIVLGEFCGTFLFLFLAFAGTKTAFISNGPADLVTPLGPAALLYIATSFGCSLAITVWIFYRITGGMFNPAVTLGLLLAGVVKPLQALVIILTQMVAAICATAMVDGILPGPLFVNNRLLNGTSIVQGLFLEMFLTSQLVLTVYFLAVEKHRGTFLAPLGIGLSAFIAHIAGTHYTGTSINPVRSFGPDVLKGFSTYHYIFWIGPLLGSVLAFGIYKLLKWFDYEYVNPAQDAADAKDAAQAVEEAEIARTSRDSRRSSQLPR